jgi:hypothetical protein
MQDVVLAGSLSLRALALVGCLEDGELVLRKTDGGRRLASGWDALLDRLTTLDRTTWHDLHVWGEWPAEEAIAMGQPFALRAVAPVLTDLARVYLDTVWPRGRNW